MQQTFDGPIRTAFLSGFRHSDKAPWPSGRRPAVQVNGFCLSCCRVADEVVSIKAPPPRTGI